jgi:Holliday junction resolvasome RuvABC endonuclease subunit
MSTLALDLGGSCGWATDAGGDIRVGVWDCTPSDESRRSPEPFWRLWDRLENFAVIPGCDAIVFEETFAKGAARFRLDGMEAVTMLWCHQHRKRWQRVTPGTWKKEMCGSGKTNKDEYHRLAIVQTKGLYLPTNDHAAALWLLLYGTCGGQWRERWPQYARTSQEVTDGIGAE